MSQFNEEYEENEKIRILPCNHGKKCLSRKAFRVRNTIVVIILNSQIYFFF